MAPKFAASIHADAADLQSLPLNITAVGVNQVILAKDSTDVIRVYRLALISKANNNLTFQDGSNSLSGPIPLVPNQGLLFKFDTKPWFSTSMGNNLNINLTTGQPVTGILYYTGGATPQPSPFPVIDSQPLGMP